MHLCTRTIQLVRMNAAPSETKTKNMKADQNQEHESKPKTRLELPNAPNTENSIWISQHNEVLEHIGYSISPPVNQTETRGHYHKQAYW